MHIREEKIDYWYLIIVVLIVGFGLLMLSSVSAPSAYERFGDSYYFLRHQVTFGLILGSAGLIFAWRVPYTFWKKHASIALFFSIFLLVLVFIPGLSAGIGTAHSWISIANIFSVQPSELVKLTFLIYLAAWLEQRSKGRVTHINSGLLPFVGVLSIIMFLLVLQPDVGTMSIIAVVSVSIYFISGAPISHLMALISLGTAGLIAIIGFSPYRAARFTTFLHPELDPQGIGYHINQALLAVGSGGWFGLGFGHSRQKFQYLPEVIGDSIFAVIAEEMGFIISLIFILLFLALLWRTIVIAKGAPDAFSRYIVVGVGAWLIIQAFVNIASMMALLPMTGVPLTFVSYGGSSLISSLLAVGLVLNISKYSRI